LHYICGEYIPTAEKNMIDNSRRHFLSKFGAAAGTLALGAVVKTDASAFVPNPAASRSTAAAELASDESFWLSVRRGFDLPPGITNLDNGYCNPLSRETLADLAARTRYIQQLPATRLTELYEDVTGKYVRPGIAEILGVPANEIALTRNATESLDTVILGLPMAAGDEIVCCATDYYAMLDALEQRRDRDKVVVRMIRPPFPASSADQLVEMYERAINKKTKLVLVTHASNVTGQIFPVKRIAAAAHRVGAEVLVDGAQTMALLDYKITDLDCDYYGASLHKWLMAPVGMGILWMRAEHMPKVWPLVPPPPNVRGRARFEWCGTYPEFISSAALPAINFHKKLGAARKEARARYLTNYWRSKVEKIRGVKFYTTGEPDSACGLGIFEIANVDAAKLQQELWQQHKILVQHMKGEGRLPELSGIRVTPNVYTTVQELDRFVNALKQSVRTA
jgi:selenocysteine lyase/cysteine desulfurase